MATVGIKGLTVSLTRQLFLALHADLIPVVKEYIDNNVRSKDVAVGQRRQHAVADWRVGASDTDMQ